MEIKSESLYHIVVLNENLQFALRKIIFCYLHTRTRITINLIHKGLCQSSNEGHAQYDITAVHNALDKSFAEYNLMTSQLIGYLKEKSDSYLFYFNPAMMERMLKVLNGFSEASATKLLSEEENIAILKHYKDILDIFEKSSNFQFTKAEVQEAYKKA